MPSPDDDDDDAHALARIAASGRDMELPLDIDFIADCLDMPQAETAATQMRALGYESRVWEDEVDGSVTLYVTTKIVPTYDNLIKVRDQINQNLKKFDLATDDWGAFA